MEKAVTLFVHTVDGNVVSEEEEEDEWADKRGTSGGHTGGMSHVDCSVMKDKDEDEDETVKEECATLAIFLLSCPSCGACISRV